MKAKVEVSEANKQVIRENIATTLSMGSSIAELPKSLRWVALCFNSAVFKMKLSQEKTFNIVMEFLNKMNPDIPDGADLVDAVGDLCDQSGLLRAYSDEIPAFRSLVDCLSEEGLCQATVGLYHPSVSVEASVKTEGIKELFELVRSGVETS